MSNTVSYYFLAPTWHNHPKSGTLQLGNVITALQTPERPVYRGAAPPAPQTLDEPPEPGSETLRESWQPNYEFSTEKMKTGKFGIWTKFLSFLGVGVDLEYKWDNSNTQNYIFERLETTEFYPSDEYIQKCLESPPVARLIANRKKLFFIITGIKAVIGATAQSTAKACQKVSAGVEVDGTVPGIAPISLGPEAEMERKRSQAVAWEGSSDFVFAYRVQKISVSKGGVEATHDDYKKGAMLEWKNSHRSGRAGGINFAISAPAEEDVTNGGFKVEDGGADGACALPLVS